MNKNRLILLFICLTILFNCFLTFLLLWSPYTLYFDRPELSDIPFKTRDNYAAVAVIINFLILIGLTILMISKYRKAKRLFAISPLFSLLTFILVLYLNKYYPDTESQYTKSGYQYLEQKWYLHGDSVFKRFKSDKPLDTYTNMRTIIWHLDSLSDH